MFTDGDSNLSIAKLCPNLKKLCAPFDNDFKVILNNCQHLECIVICYGESCLNERKVLETVAKHSPKNLYELKPNEPKLFSEDLESFFG